MRENYSTARKNLWIALSELYVDNEIQEYDLQQIVKAIDKGQFTLKEAKRINREEVFSVLKYNLMGIAGNWTGFDPEWLIGRITHYLEWKVLFLNWPNSILYFSRRKMFRKEWQIIESKLNEERML
ncbi:DUF7079 family protein [Portibacter marinus]|uniref:DUF7079 family protein n=1 Tax=Portibacter marinus TaxID=2898660 RepID=UPI001F1AD1A3|nr:hypothetical protein [Portibacter marinus]